MGEYVEVIKGLLMINRQGRIKTVDRYVEISPNRWGGISYYHAKSRDVKAYLGSNGYMNVSVQEKGVMRNFTVHRLMAMAFIPNPDNLPCVNHKNENKLDNRVENLEWCTYEYNKCYGEQSKARNKKVKCVYPNGTEEYFESIAEAELKFCGNKRKTKICSYLSGEVKTSPYGVDWYYV